MSFVGASSVEGVSARNLLAMIEERFSTFLDPCSELYSAIVWNFLHPEFVPTVMEGGITTRDKAYWRLKNAASHLDATTAAEFQYAFESLVLLTIHCECVAHAPKSFRLRCKHDLIYAHAMISALEEEKPQDTPEETDDEDDEVDDDAALDQEALTRIHEVLRCDETLDDNAPITQAGSPV